MAIASISKRFGKAVRSRRAAAGLSQEKLAESAELHPTYVSMVERAVCNPTLDVSLSIAQALRVGLPQLIEEAQAKRRITIRGSRRTNKTHAISTRRIQPGRP